METREDVGVEAVPYCCSTCDGGGPSHNLAIRTRKTRSLSTSAATSASEYRYNYTFIRYVDLALGNDLYFDQSSLHNWNC